MSWSRTAGSGEGGGLDDIAGRWKVTEVPAGARGELLPAAVSEEDASRDLRGLVVVLEAQGDVAWEVPPEAPPGLPLFETGSAHLHKDSLTFLGGVHGWSLTFKVKGEPGKGWMLLESDTDEDEVFFSLSLTKEGNSVQVINDYFSLRKALDEAFFSDISFACSDGGRLQAHRAVLAAAYPAMQEPDWLDLFQTQPVGMGRLLLSCIYLDCLPRDLTVAHAKQLVTWVAGQPKLARLSQLVSAFIEANNLKQKLMCLIDELLALLQDAKRTVSMVNMADSVKVKYTIKQLSKDAALGGAKFSLLCQLYTRNRKEMGKADSRDVLDYLRARVVMFIDLVRELLAEAVGKWEALSQVEQLDIATELLPDIEQVWDLFLQHTTDLQASLSLPLEGRSGDQGAGLAMMLHLISHGSERKRLHKIRKEFLESVEIAQRKREQWKRYSEEEKAGQVLTVVGKLVNEVDEVQESLETRKRQLLLENGLEWRTFRSYVDIACMYMSWGLQKMISVKDPLKQLLYKAVKFVGRLEVCEALVYLGLLGQDDLGVWLEEASGETGLSSGKLPKSLLRAPPGLEPPRAADSVLAQGCVQLASSQLHTDMEFVLEPATPSEEEGREDPTVIHAHRVIVASRCEWACRALLSGMIEAQKRRIVVSGVEEDVFRLFLHYLYGGHLVTETMATETLVNLMAVADRFDESRTLLHSCETLLVGRLEDSSVLQLLAVADTVSTPSLREACLQYIIQRPDVIMDGHSCLSESLLQELRALLSGTQDPTLALRHARPPQALPLRTLVQGHDLSGASSEDEEELQVESDTLEWDTALESLRAVVGSEVRDDVLRDLLLAADMDINRAVNFFFNT